MLHPVAPVAGVDVLLDELVAGLPDVDGAVVLSPDGHLLAASRDVDVAFADHLAAVSAGLYGLACSIGQFVDSTTVRQAIIEMEHALLVVAPIGPVAILAAVLDGAPDFASVGGQIADFAAIVGERLGVRASAVDLAGAS